MQGRKVQEDRSPHKWRPTPMNNCKILLAVVSVQVCLLSIRLQSLEPYKPLVVYSVFHSLLAMLFEYWLAAASHQLAKTRLHLKEYVTMAACMVGYYICTSRISPENEVLMNFTTLILLPMLVVGFSEDFCLPSQLSLLLHLLAVSFRFRHDVQQILGLLAFHALLFKVGLDRAGSSRSQELTRSIFGTMSFMLSIMADGFLILDDHDMIVGVNEGVDVCLGTTSGPDGSELRGKAFSSIFGGQTRSGMNAAWFTRPDSKRIKLETYTVPCWLSAESVNQILDQRHPTGQTAVEPGACICALRITEEEQPKPLEPEPVIAPAHHTLELSTLTLQGVAHGQIGGLQDQAPASLLGNRDARRHMEASSGALADPCTKALAPLFFKSPWQFETLESGALRTSGSYKKIEELGQEAGRGSCCVAENANGKRMLIKEISLSAMQYERDFPLHLKAISREAEALRKIAWASPVVIKLNDCWLQNDFTKACLVTEWLPNTLEGALSKFRHEDQLVSLVKEDARKWFAHMVSGVAAIHAAGFVHRDVKPSNVWMTEDYQRCKIAGLGISRPLRRKSACSATRHNSLGSIGTVGSAGSQYDHDAESAVGSNVGSTLSENSSMVSGFSALTSFTSTPNLTNPYSSPEMARECRYTERTDIFSLGCILLEMMTLAPLAELGIASQEDSSPEEVAWSLVADTRVRCFEVAEPQGLSVNSSDLPELAISMLSLDPSLRPVASDIIGRSGRLQSYLPEILEESPKLRAVLLKRQRRVHFPNMGRLEDDGGEEDWAGSDKSSSELAPAVA